MADMAAFVSAKLKNKAKAVRINYQQCLQRFELTDRMKDFYDIYFLLRMFDFDGEKLKAAIFETLQRRSTSYDRDRFKRIVALADDEDMKKRWKLFLKNIKDNALEFQFVIAKLQIFLESMFDAMVNEKEWPKAWTKAWTENNGWR